jgi:hypothetical protein
MNIMIAKKSFEEAKRGNQNGQAKKNKRTNNDPQNTP